MLTSKTDKNSGRGKGSVDGKAVHGYSFQPGTMEFSGNGRIFT